MWNGDVGKPSASIEFYRFYSILAQLSAQLKWEIVNISIQVMGSIEFWEDGLDGGDN